MLKKILQGLGIGLAAALIAAAVGNWRLLNGLETRTYDWRVRMLAKPSPFTDQIRLILLDQNSLDWGVNAMGLSWPWDREVYTALIAFCKRQGAKTISFDVVFTEPSRRSVEDDRALGSSIAAASNFVGTVFLGKESGNRTNWPAGIPLPPKADIAPGARVATLPRAAFPVPEIATNATLLGNVHSAPDSDGIHRRLKLFTLFDGQAIPFLGLAAYLAASPHESIAIAPREIRIGSHTVPLDRRGNAILRYRGPAGTHPRISAAAVIQSELQIQEGKPPVITDPILFKDKYIFFGFSAPGLLDLRPTPVKGVYPGVEISATFLDNLLAGDFVRRTPLLFDVLIALLLSCLCGAGIRAGRARDNVACFIIALPLPLLLTLWAYQRGYWMSFTVLETGVVLSLVTALMVNYAVEGKQKRFIRNAFKYYLSEDVIQQLTQNPDRLKLGGELRTLTIHFSDIKGFSTFSEKLDPPTLTTLMNDYLTAMTDIIQEEGGTVDKYIGDAVVAFWNAPLTQEDHAVRGVRAALRCQRRLAELRPELKARTGADVYCRIGLHTGPVKVGNMGSHTRFNYTMLGDAANLASRLEGVNKQFGTYAMISEATRVLLGDAFAMRELSQIAVKGRAGAVRVFEPMWPDEYAARRDVLETFARGLAAYYAGRFPEAIAIFETIQEKDPPAGYYIKRCQDLIAHPPAAWDGVWVMTEK